MTAHPEMEQALGLVEATLAGSPADAERLTALLLRVLSGDIDPVLLARALAMHRRDAAVVSALVDVVLGALGRAGVAPRSADQRNLPAALARHAEGQP